MRLDLFLKNTNFLKKRNQAKKGIEIGRIRVNGKEVKPAYKIKKNDIVELNFEKAIIKFRVLDIPEKQIKKEAQKEFVELIAKERKDIFE